MNTSEKSWGVTAQIVKALANREVAESLETTIVYGFM